jgi:hypothetical protein
MRDRDRCQGYKENIITVDQTGKMFAPVNHDNYV